MKKGIRGVIVLATVILGLAVTAAPVLAFDMRTSDSVTVDSNEVVNEDLYIAGRTLGVNGTVNADIFAAGQAVTIGGTVADGVTAAGQTVILSANVGNGVRIAAQAATVGGTIGRDLVVACNDLAVSDSAVVMGDLAFGANTATISGKVDGNVLGGANTLVIDGVVDGNVTVEVGVLDVRPGATITGNLTYTSRKEATLPAGAVHGSVVFTQQADNKPSGSRWDMAALGPLALFAGFVWKLLAYLLAFITGLVLILVCPRHMAGASSAIRDETGPVAGWGAIALFVVPIAAIVICITVVGLPLGIISLLLWGILLYLSQLPVGLFLGHLILGRHKPLESKGLMIGSLALGLLLISLVRLIPFLGFFIAVATALFGMGAVIVGERRAMQSRASGGEGQLR